MNTATLYSFRRCPYAIRARLGILYSQTPVALREIELKNKPEILLRHSPKGTVPVLTVKQKDGTKVIDESIDIMLWALNAKDPSNILPRKNSYSEHKTQQLINTNDNYFKKWLDKYKYFDRQPEHSQKYYRQQAEIFLQELEFLLQDKDFLLDVDASFIDIAIFPFIRQFAYVDKSWFDGSEYHNLKKWLSYWLKSEIFSRAMIKYQPWLLMEQEYQLGKLDN
ncbi:glutathione S-transferase [Parashewanella spongiae]|uniref:Glutathione S-transferase n=1 Tax=Parashewanella spongiae TaxID=342950 RepID=A0A3A6TPS2_9GAMM|nr:glutathione S-transferase [Parashewanella spongiae]MCL1077610.1 glutathione S-transferase [Parashewanella spongiae]RJY13163.1 glutathione S-transferase [Parashewanella spongiae]